MYFRSDHPLRHELHNELHARPSLYFDSDSDVWHVAIVGEEGPPSILDILPKLEDVSSTQLSKSGIGRFANGRLKWEVHTEFLTLTFVVPPDNPKGEPPQAFRELCDRTEGRVITSIRVLVRNDADNTKCEKLSADSIASDVGGGDAEVYSNFRLSDGGFVEIILFNRRLNAYRTGRMVRRLLEIETYRMMALLAAPVAQETVRRLQDFDKRVHQLLSHMQGATKIDKTLLSEVTMLSSDVLNFSAVARRRFGATKAYAEIVSSRIKELREERVEQRQRVSTFIDRRFQPAVRSFRAAERRLDELARRVSLTGDLLRTTIQVQLEDQNAALLASMEERTRAQLHIQQAVEGFSVIAISYYAIALAKMWIDGFSEIGLDIHVAKLIVFGAVPFVLLVVWYIVRRVRRMIIRNSD